MKLGRSVGLWLWRGAEELWISAVALSTLGVCISAEDVEVAEVDA